MTTSTATPDRDRLAQADALRDMLGDEDGPLANVRRGYYVAFAALNDDTGEVAVGLEKVLADNPNEALGSSYAHLSEKYAAEDGYRPPILRIDADHFLHVPGLENPILPGDDDFDPFVDGEDGLIAEEADIFDALDDDPDFFEEVRGLYRRRRAG